MTSSPPPHNEAIKAVVTSFLKWEEILIRLMTEEQEH